MLAGWGYRSEPQMSVQEPPPAPARPPPVHAAFQTEKPAAPEKPVRQAHFWMPEDDEFLRQNAKRGSKALTRRELMAKFGRPGEEIAIREQVLGIQYVRRRRARYTG